MREHTDAQVVLCGNLRDGVAGTTLRLPDVTGDDTPERRDIVKFARVVPYPQVVEG
jgi:hypothetical protein